MWLSCDQRVDGRVSSIDYFLWRRNNWKKVSIFNSKMGCWRRKRQEALGDLLLRKTWIFFYHICIFNFLLRVNSFLLTSIQKISILMNLTSRSWKTVTPSSCDGKWVRAFRWCNCLFHRVWTSWISGAFPSPLPQQTRHKRSFVRRVLLHLLSEVGWIYRRLLLPS